MRYRVEVDQTLTFQIDVDGDTCEEAIEKAEKQIRAPSGRGGQMFELPILGVNVIARDAIELEPVP